MSLFAELKRRKVFRVSAAYAVVAWLVVEVSDTVFPRLGLPDWTVTFVILLLLLGFPVAVFLAWAYDLTPDGVKRTEQATAGTAPPSPPVSLGGRKLDFAVIAVLVVIVGWLGMGRFGPGGEPTGSGSAHLEASIAVLPFADLSAERDQEYFADGLAEEILNLLAGVRELRVSGRTSSFAFKGRDVSIPEIGRALGVAHVLEGSVRKSGDRVRITAQLVKTGDGFHIWSETFDRRLEDVFAIQDEIAGAIAAALERSLVGQASGTASFEAYDLFLQARTLIYRRTPESLREARRLIDRALELDPAYPPALAASGELWLLLSDSPTSYGDIPEPVANRAAREQLERALELDPDLADAHAAMGLLFIGMTDYARAQAHLARALAINPSLTNANHWNALNLSRQGKARESVAAATRFAELDPLFLTNLSNLAMAQALMGRFDEAEPLAQRLVRSYPERGQPLVALAVVRYHQGRLAEARTTLDRALEGEPEGLGRWVAELVGHALGDCEAVLRHSTGWAEARCLVALGRGDEGISRTRARLEASPENAQAVLGLLEGLALSGRYDELLDWVAGRGEDAASLDAMIPADMAAGSTIMPIAAAYRAAGRETDLVATLAYWGGVLSFLEENGYATGGFRFDQATHDALSGRREAALARLEQAIDLGFRDPWLDRAPAFEPWHGDPEFLAQAARMRDLIDAERATLGMGALP
jgi:TolB-like protein